MIIEDFSVEALQHHSLWYLLKKQYGQHVDVVRPTPAGNDPWTDFRAYRMFNGRILVGFSSLAETVHAQGLMAIGEGVSEHISTQAHERVQHLCAIQPPNDDLGTFIFTDSQPIPSNDKTDWRCDVSFYGPFPFPDREGTYHRPVEEKSVILDFESILTVASVGHLIYVRRSNYAEQRWQFVNNAITPMTAPTLSECMKLVYEWSVVSQDPFNNSEPISQKAAQFCSITGLEQWHIDAYPDMQIARFLAGRDDARMRPEDAVGPQEDLIVYIKQNSSFVSLASLLDANPGTWDVQDIAELEQTSLDVRKAAFYKHHTRHDYPGDGNVPEIIWEKASVVFSPWFEVFSKAKGNSKWLMEE